MGNFNVDVLVFWNLSPCLSMSVCVGVFITCFGFIVRLYVFDALMALCVVFELNHMGTCISQSCFLVHNFKFDLSVAVSGFKCC